MALTYRQAGVDIAGVEAWLSRARPLIRSTHRPGVLADRGQFAGLFHLARAGVRDPVLVASTDGVGTKLTVARMVDAHEAIGVDVVAMNANDVVVYGATPLFFLDYLAIGRLDRPRMTRLVRGIARGCRQAGCALLGGETAQMPGVYRRGEYDVAGFCVGVAERSRLIDGSKVRLGDAVVGLASSGVHANGFSLIRRVFSRRQLWRRRRQLMAPTRIYVKPVLSALQAASVHAIAHITGGGISRRLGNLTARQPGLSVRLSPGSWPVPAVFRAIQRAGHLSTEEMMRTFNMGIGMALVVPPQEAGGLARLMARRGLAAWPIGTIQRGGGRQGSGG
jgi:phosphoribosylformylglycinamidine cyclo-ligase